MGNPEIMYRNSNVANAYDEKRFTSFSGRMGDQKEKSSFLKALNCIEQPINLVLDLPCGTGRMTEVLLRKGKEVIGADISFEMMQVARQKLTSYERMVRFAQADIKKLPFNSNTFDLVTCIRLFGHFSSHQRLQMLKEMARVSRRWLIVQWFHQTSLTELKRFVKRNMLHIYEGVNYPALQSEIAFEIDNAGLRTRKKAWCAKYYSEEVFILLEKD